MNKTMPEITSQDTGDVFIGSGALSYSWWELVEMQGISHPDNADDWHVTVTVLDDDTPGKRYTFNHAEIMKAVRKIAAGRVPGLPSDGITVRECRTFIFDGPEESDFDAESADNVLQVVAFGEVVYG